MDLLLDANLLVVTADLSTLNRLEFGTRTRLGGESVRRAHVRQLHLVALLDVDLAWEAVLALEAHVLAPRVQQLNDAGTDHGTRDGEKAIDVGRADGRHSRLAQLTTCREVVKPQVAARLDAP